MKANTLESLKDSRKTAQLLFENEEARIKASIITTADIKEKADYLGKAGNLFLKKSVFSGSSNPNELNDGLLRLISDQSDMDELTKLRLKQGVADLVKDVEKDGVKGGTYSKWKNMIEVEKANLDKETKLVS